MILLLTHVVSGARKPEPAVRLRLDERAAETLYLSSVSVPELMFGIAALFKVKRKDRWTIALEGALTLVADRIFTFDADAAHRCAHLAVNARAAGRSKETSPPKGLRKA